MEIRPLTENDASDYQMVRLRALKEHPEAFGRSYESQRDTPIEEVAESLRKTSESPEDFFLGCYVDGEMVGMVRFSRFEGEKVRHNGMITQMYVASEMQGRGLGKSLLTEAIGMAKAIDGVEQVMLSVVTTNAQARGLYRSLGFEVYGLQKRVLFVKGEYYDEEHMMLDLRG